MLSFPGLKQNTGSIPLWLKTRPLIVILWSMHVSIDQFRRSLNSPVSNFFGYLELKRENCANLFSARRIYSWAIHLGGHVLSAHCNMDQLSSVYYFGLLLGMQEKDPVFWEKKGEELIEGSMNDKSFGMNTHGNESASNGRHPFRISQKNQSLSTARNCRLKPLPILNSSKYYASHDFKHLVQA